jgi:integrase
MNKVTKVTLRKKPLKKDGKLALYLDFYPPLTNPETGKTTRREFLNMWIFDNPKSKDEREHNRNYLHLSDKIKAKRELDIHAQRFDFLVKKPLEKNFLEYFKNHVDSMNDGSNKTVYSSVLKQLFEYSSTITYSQISDKFCDGFRKFLLERVKQNTAHAYFGRFKTVVNQLVKAKELPIIEFKTISTEETHRQYLTIEELQKLVETDCKKPILKQSALFSALTGLRFSDVQKLTWGEIQRVDDGHAVVFRQQKTKHIETLPIGDAALSLCGERGNPTKKVFNGINNGNDNNLLTKWMQKAGITKEITFHSFRHTYAVLLLNNDVDIYTVSKMLGHRDIKTTQIYANISDAKKRSAANKINLNL